jgi:hypothetical protein
MERRRDAVNCFFEPQRQRRLDVTTASGACSSPTLPTEHLAKQVAESLTTEIRWVETKRPTTRAERTGAHPSHFVIFLAA